MGRGGRIGRAGGGSRGFSGRSSFSRGFSSHRPSMRGRAPHPTGWSTGRNGARIGSDSYGSPGRSGGFPLWPFLLTQRRPTVIINNNYDDQDRRSWQEQKNQDIYQDTGTAPSMTGQGNAGGTSAGTYGGGQVSRPGASQPGGKGGTAAKSRPPLSDPSFIVILVIALIAEVFLLSSVFGSFFGAGSTPRERLSADLVHTSQSWYEDRLEWIYDEDELLSGMEDFYEETGVQPYLLICGDIEGYGYDLSDDIAEEYLAGLYESLFSDEGHMIYMFMEYMPSYYMTFIYTGSDADRVMDAAAREEMFEITDRLYYDEDLTDEEFFSEVFSETADEIMEDGRGAGRYVVLLLSIAIPIALIWEFLRRKKKYETEERKRRVKEILETPLEPSQDEKELREKYLKPGEEGGAVTDNAQNHDDKKLSSQEDDKVY